MDRELKRGSLEMLLLALARHGGGGAMTHDTNEIERYLDCVAREEGLRAELWRTVGPPS